MDPRQDAFHHLALEAVSPHVGGMWSLVEWRRNRIRKRPFPGSWGRYLDPRLPADLRRKLEDRIKVFLAEKNFIGCAGLEITDEIRVTIAAQACLLILGRDSYYFPKLHDILVYPGAFVVERLGMPSPGVLQDQRSVLAGESSSRLGQVVISWEAAREGTVVIHEFAHQLDQEKGYANGAPWLGRRDRYSQWSRVLSEEFARLQQQAHLGEPSLLNHYGALNPAEFFAVASEVFFTQPRDMAALHPALYTELRTFYRIDPASW